MLRLDIPVPGTPMDARIPDLRPLIVNLNGPILNPLEND